MRFVASALEKAQRRRASRKPQRLAAPDHEDLLLALGEADERDCALPQRLERGVCGRELPLPAVDHHEIGERLAVLDSALKVARHDLAHGGEVVRAFHRLHLELPILGASRAPVLEPDRRADGVGALGGRDVEADERARDAREAELATERVHRIGGALVRFQRGELELLEQVPRILLGQIDELATRAPLRNAHVRPLERALERLAILEVERYEELGGALSARQIGAREIRRENARIVFLLEVLDEVVLAREQLPAANAHDRDAGLVAVAGIAHHVAIASLDLDHHRRLLQTLEMAEHVAQLGGPLEIESGRRILHPLAHPTRDLIGAAIEKEEHLIDHRAVLDLRLREDARRLAPLDRVVEARALGHLVRHVVVARPHGEDALDDVERASHGTDVGVRTEVARPVVEQPARHEDARERLLNGHLDVRIALVVTQRDVEARPVFLDEIRLEDQRVRLGRHHDRVHVGDLPDERPRLHALRVIGGEVAAHTRAEPLGLSHVQDAPVPILPEVHSGRLGQVRDLEGNGLGRSHRLCCGGT